MTLKLKKYLQTLFKNFSYGIFHLIYGKVKSNNELSKNNPNISRELIDMGDNRIYSVFKLKKSRLYTDRIHSTSVINDNTLITDASFQIKGKYFFTEENTVLKNGTPRLLKKINGDVLSLLAGGGSNKNYWHWLFDVLPRIELFNKTIKTEYSDYLLVPDLSEKFQKETLNLLNFENKKILSSRVFRHIQPRKLFVTQHPYIIRDIAKDELNIPRWIINWLRSKFLNKINKNNSFPKKIFIDRADSPFKTRSIINENEVKKFLISKNFVPIRLSDLKFVDQVNLFSNVKNVVGLHGGGFANIIFSNPGVKVTEIRTLDTGKVIENLATSHKLNFEKIEIRPSNKNATDQQGHVEVNIDELDSKIN